MNSLIRKGAGALALLAAVLLFLAGWGFRPVQAEIDETKTITAAFTPSSAANGQEVTLTVDIQGWFGGAQLVLEYNADQLTYVDGSASSSVGATINDAQQGQLNVLYVNTSGIDLGDQDFFTARFVVNASAGESLDVSFSTTDICSTDASLGFYKTEVQTQPLTVLDPSETTTSSDDSASSQEESSEEETSSQSSSTGTTTSGAIVLLQGQQQLLATDLSGTVTWSSSDESVAVVDENGMVTMVGVGEAVITATDGSEEENFRVSTEAPASSGLTSASGVDDPEDATFLWWVLGGIGAVLVIAAVVVVVIVLKKKR